jgi:hypothetical protein
MVIALERYLIPMISKNQETSYHLALVRICTTLTKGWFRQFAIDNYPRLSNLDKDLLSISNEIINDHPLQQKEIQIWKPDTETQAIFDSINPYTKRISLLDDLKESCEVNTVSVKRTGFKITSPVNDTSISAIITNTMDYHDNACPYVHWTASVAILPSEDLKISR